MLGKVRGMGRTKLRKHEVREDIVSDKERAFCHEYDIDMNGARAVRDCGCYSHKGADVRACELLKRPRVKKYLGKLLQERVDKTELTKENVLREVANAVFRDIADLSDADGYAISNLRKLPKEIRGCIDGIEVTQHYGEDGGVVGQTVKYKLASSNGAKDMAMKHLALFAAAAVEHTGKVVLDLQALANGRPKDLTEEEIAKEQKLLKHDRSE